MIQLLPGLALLIYCIYGFFREIRLEHKRYLEEDRLGDEHIMLEIEKFLKQKAIEADKTNTAESIDCQ